MHCCNKNITNVVKDITSKLIKLLTLKGLILTNNWYNINDLNHCCDKIITILKDTTLNDLDVLH